MKNLLVIAVLCLFYVKDTFAFIPEIVVAQDGSSKFTSIQQALDSVPTKSDKIFIIFVKNGLYNEKLFIEKSNVMIAGESKDSVKIIFAELRSNWKKDHPDDYGSAVVNIKAGVENIIFYNLTVHNNYGSLYGNKDHQFAIRGDGTKIIILNCNIIADGGDTLSLWNRTEGMYYHKDCYFEGYVDFVCPRGWCLIEESKFFGHNKTAAIWHDGSNNRDQKFVIKSSYFDGVPGFPLGRFHRDAQFFLINCRFSKNMADMKIYHATSNPTPLQWGEDRIYYYNCHGDSLDYKWHADNVDSNAGAPASGGINETWVFQNKWSPSLIIQKLGLTE